MQDDGQGFDPGAIRGGTLGLRSMQERAAGQGLSFQLHSVPGEGTTVRVSVTEPPPVLPVRSPVRLSKTPSEDA